MPEADDWMAAAARDFGPPTDLRPEIPHPARIYNYYLGGKDNFAADRAAADQVMTLNQAARMGALANRAFLGRAVRRLAAGGIDQFLDIGTGIPSAGNTHEVAQQVKPDARVVYVDNDPIVLTHARALMAGAGHGATSVLQADLRDPDKILADPAVRDLIDFDRPVALMLVAILHFIDDSEHPRDIVRTLVDALPSGSMLVLSHGSNEFMNDDEKRHASAGYSNATAGLSLRPISEILPFFDGLDLLPPGLVPAPMWHPDVEPAEGSERFGVFAGVAAKR